MSLFIETIRLQDGQFGSLHFHQLRMDESIREFYSSRAPINLNEFLSSCPIPGEGLYKVRLVYDKEIQSVTISPYPIRKIRSLRIVRDDVIAYAHKFEDRSRVNKLFELRENCDDIIIVKGNHVTDASYANLVFYRDGKWVTPKTYLLNGTMRRQLLEKKIIFEEEITIGELRRYEKIKLINAMLQFDGPEIDGSQIVG
jgi:4-amino-4-deoxychorismate lyase